MSLAVINRHTGDVACRIETRLDLRDFCEKKSAAGIELIGLRGILCGVVYHGVFDTKILAERITEELTRDGLKGGRR
jgi:hypothetical protein